MHEKPLVNAGGFFRCVEVLDKKKARPIQQAGRVSHVAIATLHSFVIKPHRANTVKHSKQNLSRSAIELTFFIFAPIQTANTYPLLHLDEAPSFSHDNTPIAEVWICIV